ncbi:MAG: glutamate synthase [Christensenellales bacterium]|jgi:glutamate synthase domain-containing protein 3
MSTQIDSRDMHFQSLNEAIREGDGEITILNCLGQRFIASAMTDKKITIHGTPGNALGCYLNGASIRVHGNVQDAVGDTMNNGQIIVHGDAGDALGYAMRGGKIFVSGNSGYRTGIHMKAYGDKVPVIIVGKSAGSFLGEYQAGGLIVVLGLDEEKPVVANFTGTGMHGGAIFLRCSELPKRLPAQVAASVATQEELEEISGHIREFAAHFDLDYDSIMGGTFFALRPNAKNPYKQLYTAE